MQKWICAQTNPQGTNTVCMLAQTCHGVTGTAFLRENKKVKGLFKGRQFCFPFPCSHLQMPLKEVSG